MGRRFRELDSNGSEKPRSSIWVFCRVQSIDGLHDASSQSEGSREIERDSGREGLTADSLGTVSENLLEAFKTAIDFFF